MTERIATGQRVDETSAFITTSSLYIICLHGHVLQLTHISTLFQFVKQIFSVSRENNMWPLLTSLLKSRLYFLRQATNSSKLLIKN